jgi:UDP-N-acetylglucosamine acyltransferase
MPFPSPLLHPTALISPTALLAPDVRVGAFAVLEGKVQLGPGCVVGPHVHLIGPLTMGRDNQIFSNAVIGEKPQHLAYRDEPTTVEIGDTNVFRENVTIHRGMAGTGRTLLGNGNYLRAGSHVAHDCQVGNSCTLANNALLGGYCILGDGARVGGNSAAHQFCRFGRLAVLEDSSITTVDIPPYLVQQGRNEVIGVNVAGMQQAGLGVEQIEAMQKAYDTVYHRGFVLAVALARLEEQFGPLDVIQEFVAFARQSRRGIGRGHDRKPQAPQGE